MLFSPCLAEEPVKLKLKATSFRSKTSIFLVISTVSDPVSDTTVESVPPPSGIPRGSDVGAMTASGTSLEGPSIVSRPLTSQSYPVDIPARVSSGTDAGDSTPPPAGLVAEISQPTTSQPWEKLPDLARDVQLSAPLDSPSGNSFTVVRSYLERFVEIGSAVAGV